MHYDALMRGQDNMGRTYEYGLAYECLYKLVTCLESNMLQTYSVMGEDEWTINDGRNNNLF